MNREVLTDVIKAFGYGTTAVPAFIICTFCGWLIDEEER